MTQAPSSESEDLGAATPASEPVAEAPPVMPRRFGGDRLGFVVLAAILLLLIGGVAASPFWAPAVAPLLPWGHATAAPSAAYANLAARLDELEKRPAVPGGLAAALAAVEAAETALARRLDRLEAARPTDAALQSAVAAAQAGVTRLDAQAAAMSGELQQTRHDVAQLDQRAAELGDRVGSLEGRMQAEIGAGRTDAVLLLSLLQLRQAVAAGRPFAAEYDGFAALAQGHPALIAAARPLGDAANEGVASHAALQQGLVELAARLAAAPPPAGQGWWQEALVQLRGLVTVRRIDAPPSGPEAVVAKAQATFAAGNLAGAVATLATLSGTDAAAARPWLQMARSRLAAEAALARLQQLVTARLGAPPSSTPKMAPPPRAAPSGKAKPGPVKPGAPT
jgi:hypothetical protein